MIKKSVLIARIDDLQSKLDDIYELRPDLTRLDENRRILQSIGIPKDDADEVLRNGRGLAMRKLINPDNGKEYEILCEPVSIDDEDYSVRIQDKPYQEYFAQAMSVDELRELIAIDERIRSLYAENQRLKSLL